MQLLLHSCFNSSCMQKSHCWPASTFAAWQFQGVWGHKRWLLPLLWLLLNTMILVLSSYPTLRLQSIQGNNGVWWAKVRQSWESRHFLKWKGDPNKKISPFIKRKAQPSCKSCRSDSGEKKSLPTQNLISGESSTGRAWGWMFSVPPPSLVSAAPLHNMGPHWSLRARQDKTLRYAPGSCLLYTKKAKWVWPGLSEMSGFKPENTIQ